MDKPGMVDRDIPVPGGSTMYGELVEVDRWHWHGQLWRISCPLGSLVTVLAGGGGVTAVTQEGPGCKEVPGATGMQLPRVWASW